VSPVTPTFTIDWTLWIMAPWNTAI